MGSSLTNYEQTSEIFFSEVIAGQPETVKFRVIDAMEALGYDIIEDTPIIMGRRNAKGWATWYSSADVLEYASILTVRMRTVGQGATRLSFDYKIRHGWLNEGEKNIVVQEAKTVSAMAKASAIEKLCSVCETESTDDSRYCRNCGAPLTAVSSEPEVLRLMAETRAAKTSVVTSSIMTFALTIYMPLIAVLAALDVLSPKRAAIFISIGALLMLFTLICNLFGWNRLKRALERPEQPKKSYRKQTMEFPAAEEHLSLPQSRPFASVTEGTTNLLDPEIIRTEDQEKVPVMRRRKTRELE